MEASYITAVSALAGSVVGGAATWVTTWMSLRSSARAGHRAAEFHHRQDLFRDFINAASKAYGHALVSQEPQLQEIIDLYAMLSRMRVLCSPDIVTCADQIMRLTIDTYFDQNKTIPQLREMIRDGTHIDPLKEFSERARDELESLAL